MAVKIDPSTRLYIPGSDMPLYYGPATEEIIVTPIPTKSGFYHPKWLGEWNGFYWEDGEWVEGLSEEEITARSGLPQTLEEAKRYKQQQIVETAAQKQSSLTAGYSTTEQGTWDRKEQESRTFLENRDLSQVRYLVAEASAMVGSDDPQIIGVVTSELALAVLNAADRLRLASGTISGTRARKWREVEALQTIESVLNYPVEEGWD